MTNFKKGDRVIISPKVTGYSTTCPGSEGVIEEILSENLISIDFYKVTGKGPLSIYNINTRDVEHLVKDWDE